MSKNHFPAFQKSFLRLSLGVLLALGAAQAVQAQGVMGTAMISAAPNGGGFDYSITLQNTGSTSIGTFWFAWTATPYDFLPTMPTSIISPSGWTGSASQGYAGWSVEYYTFGSGLAPGDSATFGFTSTDDPTVMNGDSPVYPGNPTATSTLYDTSFTFSSVFVVQPAPEPSTLALFGAGALGLLFARRTGKFLRVNRA